MPVVGILRMVVMMGVFVTVQCQCPFGARSKERAIFVCLRHHFGVPFAADMTIQTNHAI